MTFGFSRDDIGGFLPDYLDKKILPVDPFQVLDRDSVGVLVETGIEKGRSVKAGPQGRDLRRARRRAELGRVLPPRRYELRQLLAVPGADRPAGRSPGADQPPAKLTDRNRRCRFRAASFADNEQPALLGARVFWLATHLGGREPTLRQ